MSNKMSDDAWPGNLQVSNCRGCAALTVRSDLMCHLHWLKSNRNFLSKKTNLFWRGRFHDMILNKPAFNPGQCTKYERRPLIKVQIFRKYYFFFVCFCCFEPHSLLGDNVTQFTGWLRVLHSSLLSRVIWALLNLHLSPDLCFSLHIALTESLWPLSPTKLHNLISFCMTHRVGFGLNRRDI